MFKNLEAKSITEEPQMDELVSMLTRKTGLPDDKMHASQLKPSSTT